jgi:hypothetical protein
MDQIVGTVASGRGQSTTYIRTHSAELKEKLGEQLVEGSLNVILNHPVKLAAENAIVFDGGKRLLWPATIEGQRGWAFRWVRAPLHVLEFVASVHLRRSLGLDDGSPVRIAIRREDVVPLGGVSHLAWFMIWAGRRHWFYSGNTYKEFAKRWSRHFGATQPGAFKTRRAHPEY